MIRVNLLESFGTRNVREQVSALTQGRRLHLVPKSEQKSAPSNLVTDRDVNSRTLPSELLLIMLRGARLSERVLFQLALAETNEIDPWLRDDIRISWLTVLHCAEGISQPWEYAFWRYLGKHPDKLIPIFVERAEKHAAMNEPEVSQAGALPVLYQSAAQELALPPKKPVSKVASPRKRSA